MPLFNRSSLTHTWNRTSGRSVNNNYMCCGVSAVAVNKGGHVDRVCRDCGTVVCDGGSPVTE